MQSVPSHHSELHSVAPPCDRGGPQFSYYGEATCLTPIISELACSAHMCIAHCSSRTVLSRKLTTRFQIVLQQMLTDAEVSSQEGCIQKVGKLVLRLLPSCRACTLVEPALPSVRPSVVGRARDSPGIKTDAGFHGVAGSKQLASRNQPGSGEPRRALYVWQCFGLVSCIEMK